MPHPNAKTKEAVKNPSDESASTESSGPLVPVRTEPRKTKVSQLPGLESETTSPIPTYDTDRYRLVRPFTTRL